MQTIQVQMIDKSWLNVHTILDEDFTVSSFGCIEGNDVSLYTIQNKFPEYRFRKSQVQ